MKIEFEVVFSGIDRENVIEKIKAIGGKCIKENTLMKRVVFQNPVNPIDSYVRVRDEGDKITCTYKETKPGELDITSVSELETDVGDFDEMVNIFRKLGLKQKSYQETYREIWKIGDEIEFMIDLWPGLKPFIEIEGENEEVVKKYSELLGFDYSMGIFGTSFQVYEKELGLSYEYVDALSEITFENEPKKLKLS